MSSGPVYNSPPGQVIRGQFHRHGIAGQYFDEMHPHFSRYVGKDPVAVVKLHAKHGIGKGFDDPSLHNDGLFFRHKDDLSVCPGQPGDSVYPTVLSISGPLSQMATVCSK